MAITPDTLADRLNSDSRQNVGGTIEVSAAHVRPNETQLLTPHKLPSAHERDENVSIERQMNPEDNADQSQRGFNFLLDNSTCLTASPEVQREDPFGDGERTEARYNKAAQDLQKALDHSRINWKDFKIPTLGDISENNPQIRKQAADLFDKQVADLFESSDKSANDKKIWSKCKSIAENLFTAMSPFAKHFLTIAKEGQSVLLLSQLMILS